MWTLLFSFLFVWKIDENCFAYLLTTKDNALYKTELFFGPDCLQCIRGNRRRTSRFFFSQLCRTQWYYVISSGMVPPGLAPAPLQPLERGLMPNSSLKESQCQIWIRFFDNKEHPTVAACVHDYSTSEKFRLFAWEYPPYLTSQTLRLQG